MGFCGRPAPVGSAAAFQVGARYFLAHYPLGLECLELDSARQVRPVHLRYQGAKAAICEAYAAIVPMELSPGWVYRLYL